MLYLAKLMFHVVAIILAAFQVLADSCPRSFLLHPNGNKNYCLTIDEVHSAGSPVYVRRCADPPAFGQVWYFMPFPRNAGYFLRNVIAGTNNLCLNAEICEFPTPPVDLIEPAHQQQRQALTPDRLESPPYNGRHLAITECYNDGANDWKQNGHHQIELGAFVDGRSTFRRLPLLTHQSPVWISATGGSMAVQSRSGIAMKEATIRTSAGRLRVMSLKTKVRDVARPDRDVVLGG